MQKFTCAIFGFLTLLLIVQELSPSVECARVRVAKVKKGRHDKRQTQQQLLGYTDVPLESSFDRPNSRRQVRPEENPYNAGNRQVDYPTRRPENEYGSNSQGSRKPVAAAATPIRVAGSGAAGDDDHCEGCDGDGIPGEPGTDYPIYAKLPKTNFDCKKQEWPGYYADVDARCQVFWICQRNKGDAFLCPNGTLFNQQVYVCDWWYNVDCAAAPDFYSRNQYIYAGPGIDLFGNPVTVKQSTSSSSSSKTNVDYVPNTTRRPSQTGTTQPQTIRPRPAGTNGNGGSSTREILQAIESAAQSGSGGNAYRREIGKAGNDNYGSFSSSVKSSTRTPSYEPTSYTTSRQIPTTVIPYETFTSKPINPTDRKSAIVTQRHYDDDIDQLIFGFRKGQQQKQQLPQQQHSASSAKRIDDNDYRYISSSLSSSPRNQIQNPFVKQSPSSVQTLANSPRRSITITDGSGGTASISTSSLKQQQNYYSTSSARPTPAVQVHQQQQNYYSTSSARPTTLAVQVHQQQQQQQKQREFISYAQTSPKPKFVDNSSAKPLKQYYSSEAGTYLPTVDPSRSVSARTNSGSSNANPFISNNYKASSQIPSPAAKSSAPAQRNGNYYGTPSTTKRNTLNTDDFENDFEEGYKFNFAKTISYSPSTQLKEPPVSARSPDIIITTPRTTPRPASSNVETYYHDLIIIPSSTRKPQTISIPNNSDDRFYDVKVLRQPFASNSNRGESISPSSSTYQENIRKYDSGEDKYRSSTESRKPTNVESLDRFYSYHPQIAESRNSNHQQQQPQPYSTQDKYSLTPSTTNTFQGDKLVTKYNTKTSYDDGDDENFVHLLRSLAKVETATISPKSQAIKIHNYDSETSATASSPISIRHYDYNKNPVHGHQGSTPVKVHVYDFSATPATTAIPPPTSTTTSPPVFGKKIKSGRKRNTSNWANYFFKSKN